MNERRDRYGNISGDRDGHGHGNYLVGRFALAGAGSAFQGRDQTGSVRGRRARARFRYQGIDGRFWAFLRRLAAIRRLTLAIIAFTQSPQTAHTETAFTMNLVRTLFRRDDPVKAQRHDQILKEVKETKQDVERITRMIRGMRARAKEQERRRNATNH